MSRFPQTSESCIEAWVRRLADTGYLPSSVRDYRSAAKIVANNMQALGISPLPYDWTEADLFSVIDYWDEKGLRVKTQKGYLTALVQLARFYDNRIPSDVKIRWPHEDRQIKWLELDQARQVLSTPMSEMQALGIELMLRMGRRRIECIRAQVSDMKCAGSDHYMVVDGKGHKRHNMPFAPTTDKVLGRWLDRRSDILREFAPRKADEIDDLFIWGRGRTVSPFSQEKCSGFDGAVSIDVSNRCGIPFSNHVLRRTFGRELYFTAGVDILLIQFYYNHASLEQTILYIGADEKRKSDAMRKIPF